MNRKNREREAASILAITELEAQVAGLKAERDFWMDVHRIRTMEALHLPAAPYDRGPWPSVDEQPLAEWERELLEGHDDLAARRHTR